MEVVTSIYHLTMKFPTPNGIGSVHGSQYDSRECYHRTVKSFRRNGNGGHALPEEDAQGMLKNVKGEIHAHYIVQEPEDDDPLWRACPQVLLLEEPPLTDEFHKGIVEDVSGEDLEELISMNIQGEQQEVIDLDPRIHVPNKKTTTAEETIPILKGIRQKRHAVSGERAVALKEEVDRLLDVGLIKESFYPEWLANPVLVKKPNGKWRTCVDFTDLNKACPKDSFPLPMIDQLVDATAGHALLSFMDA
ncbi:hypothetical protein POM88_004419 [Heracleum sosnowskyi]|uniref:Uncharacterized protein n=1 Tax=Heracleum sosnowskyi TaxID=360622 RepID=A0AAD8JIC4_9APIA|nr:hypothetical protein POM88_004419 [Heracleum sosnowskyi]